MGITLRKKKLKNGRASLYLDIHSNGVRRKESLKIYLEKPTSSVIRQENKLKWNRAKEIMLKRELSQEQVVPIALPVEQNNNPNLPSSPPKRVDFFAQYERFIQTYSRRDIKVVSATFAYLKRFVHRDSLFVDEIDRRFCEEFLAYLSQSLHGNTPVGYFKKFKMCLERCVDDGIIANNPAHKVRLVTSDELVKDILTSSEIQQLAETPLVATEVKRAFLFACCTGLRWCDVKLLKYRSIDYERNILTIVQQKVISRSSMAVLHLNINATAVSLLQMRSGEVDDLVFDLPSYSYARRLLLKWASQAGIRKHVTFHVARHSFITNLMIGGANIKTVSLLAGHSTVRHTEKYVHIVNELKQKAVDSLPKIDLGDWGKNSDD